MVHYTCHVASREDHTDRLLSVNHDDLIAMAPKDAPNSSDEQQTSHIPDSPTNFRELHQFMDQKPKECFALNGAVESEFYVWVKANPPRPSCTSKSVYDRFRQHLVSITSATIPVFRVTVNSSRNKSTYRHLLQLRLPTQLRTKCQRYLLTPGNITPHDHYEIVLTISHYNLSHHDLILKCGSKEWRPTFRYFVRLQRKEVGATLRLSMRINLSDPVWRSRNMFRRHIRTTSHQVRYTGRQMRESVVDQRADVPGGSVSELIAVSAPTVVSTSEYT